jgi:nucleoid-associated protein YgaU
MGKEKKIAVALLALLVLVFGVVLMRRLTRPSDEAAAATTSQQDTAQDPSKHSREAGDNQSWPGRTTQAASAPTLLVPAVVPSATASHPPEDVTTPWTAVSDAAKKSPGGGSVASDLPPPYIPGPPVPKGDDRYSMSATSSQVGRAETPALVPAKAPSNPFRSGASNSAAGGSASVGQGSENVRAAEPSPAADPPTARYGYSPAPPATFAAMPGPAAGSARASQPSGFSRGGRNQALQSTGGDIMPPGGASPYGSSSSYPMSPGASDGGSPRGTENFNSAGGTYQVQPNDNYWVISEKVYGSGAYFNALAEHNRSKVAQRDKLRVGETISTPTIAQLEQSYPQLCPKPSHRDTVRSRATLTSTRGAYAGGRTYEVQEGDTLFDIARHELGKASRWSEIYDLNREALGKDFDYLTPGMQLVLPSKDSSPSTDKTTRRTTPAYDR